MPKGGKRSGAGAKRVAQARTLEKMDLLRQQRAFYARHLPALRQAVAKVGATRSKRESRESGKPLQ